MCGIVAAAGEVPSEALALASWSAARRGPHSYGVAVLQPSVPTDPTSSQVWKVARGSGRLPSLVSLANISRTNLLVAHSRLATDSRTSGGVPAPDEGQPLLDPTGWTVLAHNGTITTRDVLGFAPTDQAPAHPADSHALLALVMALGVFAAAQLLHDAREPAPQAAVVAERTGVVALLRHDGLDRPAHPLYLTRFPRGWLVSSGRIDVTSKVVVPGVTTLAPESPTRLERSP